MRLLSTEPSITSLTRDLHTFNAQLIGHTNHYSQLLRRINSTEISEVILSPFKDAVLQNAQRDQNLPILYSKLPTAFIDENLALLISQPINESKLKLLEELSRRKGMSNEDLDRIVRIEGKIKSI